MYYHADTTIKHLDSLCSLLKSTLSGFPVRHRKDALQLAINHGSAEFVETLITAGIDIPSDAALHAALASRFSLDVMKAAVDRGADFTLTSADGRTVIHYAATNTDHPEVLKFLIERYPELLSSRTTEGKTALWSAIYQGSAELGKTLNTAGIDINARDNTGKTALHAALAFTERATRETMEYVRRDMVERCTSIATALLEHGIHVGIADQRSYTELHYALPVVPAYRNYLSQETMLSIVRLLLSSSTVDVNAPGNGGLTPLHLAARVGWLKVVRVLVEEGNADLNRGDNYGVTPADSAQAFPAVVRYLSRRAAISSL